MIDAYLAVLRRDVRGAWLPRRGMLREIRDGLQDAADAHRQAGASVPEAERRAVAEFGPPGLVVAELRAELAAATARYLSGVVVVVGTAQFALTHLSWQSAAASQGWPAPSHAYAVLAHAVDVANVVLLVVSGLSVLALGVGARVLPTRRVVRGMAIGVLIVLAGEIVTGVLLSVYAPQHVGTKGALEAVMLATSLLSMAWIAGLALCCLRLTSPHRAGVEDGADDAAELRPRLPLRR